MNMAWSMVRLGEVLKPTERGEIVDAAKEYRLLGIRLDGQGPFLRETVSGTQTSAKKLLRVAKDDFIYSRLFACRGAFGVISKELDSCHVSGEFPTFVPVSERIDVNFLRYWFRLPTVIARVNEDCTGSTPLTRNRYKEQFFRALEIPLPPLAEQQRIVARIEELAAKIADALKFRSQADIETAALVKTALYGLVKDVNLSGRLGDILAGPPRNGWSAKCDNAEGGTPVLSLSAVTQFHYRGTEFKRTSLHAKAEGHFWLKPGDILITRSNTPELVGHAAIYDGSPTPCIYPDLMMRLEIKKADIDRRFVWYWLQSPIAREFIIRNAQGTSPTMKKISQGIVMSIPFPTSFSPSEQRRIVAELDALQSHVDRMKRLQAETCAELDALLPSILDRAFRGEL